jgi:hypothetical protein
VVNSKGSNFNQEIPEFPSGISQNFVSISPLSYCKFNRDNIYLEYPQRINEENGNINEISGVNPKYDISSQSLYMLNPSKYCKCHQRTVYFQSPDSEINTENVSKINIESEEYFVNAYTNKSGLRIPRCLKNLFVNNEIQLFNYKDFNITDSTLALNVYWKELSNNLHLNNINKYQKYNHMLKYKQLSNKKHFYDNYNVLKKKFPKDYNYMPNTYTSLEEFKKDFKDYKVSKDNLWLVKPNFSTYGIGIHFLKDVNKVRRGDIVTKYVSNPLLINNKKFDFRIYVLVTGHDPLKIYLNEQCFARLATADYDIDINNLDNTFKHLTNIHVQRKNKESKASYVMTLDEVKKHIKENYNIEFSDIWKGVKDLIIKSFIAVNRVELEAQKEFNLASNSLFQLFGLDVIVDQNAKPWLIEINGHPSLSDKETASLNDQNVKDILNIAGLVPFSHFTGTAMEGECEYKDSVDEAVQQSICEFTRPTGKFERIFPTKDNIDYYKQFFEEVTINNQALWDEIKNNDFE